MTTIEKHSVLIAGHRTSVSLEPEFWLAISEQAAREGRSITQLVEQVDRERGERNLSSALRLYVLHALQALIAHSAD
jgi:predicted DNA-binding ribbon-helix-helix protein